MGQPRQFCWQLQLPTMRVVLAFLAVFVVSWTCEAELDDSVNSIISTGSQNTVKELVSFYENFVTERSLKESQDIKNLPTVQEIETMLERNETLDEESPLCQAGAKLNPSEKGWWDVLCGAPSQKPSENQSSYDDCRQLMQDGKANPQHNPDYVGNPNDVYTPKYIYNPNFNF